METVAKIVGAVVLIFAVSVVVSLLTAYPVMLLWNWLGPDLFEWPTIDFLQALGITALCSLLFKSTSKSSSKE
jgi:hypothetical protein